jgi:hypothetical protein
MNPNHPLERLRADLSAPTESYADPTLFARLAMVESGGLLHVEFSGLPFDEPFTRLCQILREPHVADNLASIILRCPDEGANGTCNWDLTELIEGNSIFRSLQLFQIQQTRPGDHNRIIIGADYDESGILGKLLRKAPILDSLVTPSAPDVGFFEVLDHPLRHLDVDAGYNTQGFIGNLADSRAFPGLQSLAFGEYNETYIDSFPEGCTPFADYRRLFESQAFAAVRTFTLRNPVCTAEEIAALRALRSERDLQFKVVRFSSEYVPSVRPPNKSLDAGPDVSGFPTDRD